MSVRVGFIGTGGIAQRHLRTLGENSDAQLIAYCDIDLERAQKAAEEYGGNAYRDFETMLDGEELDAYVLGVDKPLKTFAGRCIAIVHRLDDDDDKLVVVPEGVNLSDAEILAQTHFQERFFRVCIVRE